MKKSVKSESITLLRQIEESTFIFSHPLISKAIHWYNNVSKTRAWLITIVLVLFIIAFLPRLYKIDNPIADWHSWRQADTASVTRNFVKEGFNPLFPKFDALNSLNEGSIPNPERYFFAEFPIYNSIVYPFYVVFGVDEVYSRLVSVFFASLTSVFLYLLVRKFQPEPVAVMAGVFFAIIPFNIYYGRVIMPDPLHVFFGVLSLYLVTIWLDRNSFLFAVLAGLSTAATILTKPYGLILGLPIGYLLLKKYGLQIFKRSDVYLFGALSLLPFFAWRWHIHNYPEGMFGTEWLFNQGNIRFKGSHARWLIFDRMNRLIFATGGFVLLWIGIVQPYRKKEGLFFLTWFAGIILFFIVIAKGNVTHDYYQMPLVPLGCVFMAKGFVFLLQYGKTDIQRILNSGIAVVLVLIMLAFGWYEVRGFFNINRPEIVEAGEAVNDLLPQDAIVITPYLNDPAFLYQTNRYGYTLGGHLIPKYKDEGATHLVAVDIDEYAQIWVDQCKEVASDRGENDSIRWIIVDLQSCEGELPQWEEDK